MCAGDAICICACKSTGVQKSVRRSRCNNRQQFLEVGCSKTRNRIPSLRSLPHISTSSTPLTNEQILTLKPAVPHPGLLPPTISLNVLLTSVEYKSGLRNPSGDKPFTSRASFNSETIPANVGVAAEVPLMATDYPPRAIWKRSAWAATSGIPWRVTAMRG